MLLLVLTYSLVEIAYSQRLPVSLNNAVSRHIKAF